MKKTDNRLSHRTKGKSFVGCEVDLFLAEQINDYCNNVTHQLRSVYRNAKPYSKSDFLRDAINNGLYNSDNHSYVNVRGGEE